MGRKEEGETNRYRQRARWSSRGLRKPRWRELQFRGGGRCQSVGRLDGFVARRTTDDGLGATEERERGTDLVRQS